VLLHHNVMEIKNTEYPCGMYTLGIYFTFRSKNTRGFSTRLFTLIYSWYMLFVWPECLVDNIFKTVLCYNIKNAIFEREINDFTVRRLWFHKPETRSKHRWRFYFAVFYTVRSVCKQRKFHRLELRAPILKTQTSGAYKTLVP